MTKQYSNVKAMINNYERMTSNCGFEIILGIIMTPLSTKQIKTNTKI